MGFLENVMRFTSVLDSVMKIIREKLPEPFVISFRITIWLRYHLAVLDINPSPGTCPCKPCHHLRKDLGAPVSRPRIFILFIHETVVKAEPKKDFESFGKQLKGEMEQQLPSSSCTWNLGCLPTAH